MTVRGLVGALDVSHRASSPDDRAVLPHEGIHPAQADSLADRMTAAAPSTRRRSCSCTGPRARPRPGARVAATAPTDDFVDRNDQRHRIWAIRDPGAAGALADAPGRLSALIADGHHRYAAYLRMQARQPGRRVRPRPGHAGRPGGHPAVPRPDPPGARRRQPRRPGGRGRDRGGGYDVADRRPPSRRWARTPWSPPTARSGRLSSSTCRPTGPRSRRCTTTWSPRWAAVRRRSTTTTPSTRR